MSSKESQDRSSYLDDSEAIAHRVDDLIRNPAVLDLFRQRIQEFGRYNQEHREGQRKDDPWIWSAGRQTPPTPEETLVSSYVLLACCHDDQLRDRPPIITPELWKNDKGIGSGLNMLQVTPQSGSHWTTRTPDYLDKLNTALKDVRDDLGYKVIIEKKAGIQNKQDAQAPVAQVGEGELPDTESTMSVNNMAKMNCIPLEPLRKRLDRRRMKDGTCFVEVENVGGRTPKYLYYPNKVMDIIDDLKISASKTSDNRPSKNNKKNMS